MTDFPGPRYMAGVGCRKGADADEIVSLILAVLYEAGVSPDALDCIGTIQAKLDEPGLRAAAWRLGLPLVAVPSQVLSKRQTPSTGPIVGSVTLPAVAEAVALSAGILVVPKRKSARATCALGRYSPNAAMASSRLATSVAGP